jgi:hypothetical protein
MNQSDHPSQKHLFQTELVTILQNTFSSIIGEPIQIHITPQGQVHIVKSKIHIVIPGFQYAQLRTFQTSNNPFLTLSPDHVNLIMSTISQFWHNHEDIFLHYLSLLSHYKDAIAICSIYLTGINLSTLHMAQVTWSRVSNPPDFVQLWCRHIISFGKQTHFKYIINESQIQLEVTTLHHHIQIHISFMNTPVHFYFKIPSYEQIHFLQNIYPLYLNNSQVESIKQAWHQHRSFWIIMQKLQTRHISHSKSIDNSPIPVQTLSNITPFYSIWPFASRTRKTFPQEFKTATWCMESPISNGGCSIVIPFTSFTLDSLMKVFSIPLFQLDTQYITSIHALLTQLWTSHECLFLQYIHSQRNKFIQYQCLSQWCEQTFGIDISSIEAASNIKRIAIQRINSIYNTVLATLQNPNQLIRFRQQQLHWNKKHKILKVLSDDDIALEFHMDPLPDFKTFHSIFNNFPFSTSFDHLLQHQLENIYQEFQSFCIQEIEETFEETIL